MAQEVDCPNCKGKGKIKVAQVGNEENKMDLDCPTCLGTGKLYAKKTRKK